MEEEEENGERLGVSVLLVERGWAGFYKLGLGSGLGWTWIVGFGFGLDFLVIKRVRLFYFYTRTIFVIPPN